jgi:hypothetical protein
VTLLPDVDDDEFTQLTDVNTPRADMVGAPAHGWPGWLVMKQDADGALLDPEFVRDLLSKNTSEEAPVPQAAEAGETTLPNGITLKGSPAAMAAFLNARNARPTPADVAAMVAKADLSAKAQNDLPDSAFAYIESGGKKDAEGKTTPRSLRHFNISDKAHADNAAARIAQGAKFGEEAKPKVEAAQREFGEKKVSKEAGMPDAVTKDLMDAAGDAMPLDDGADGLDPTVPLAMPGDETDVPGDPTDPGSPAWEAIDAATAAKWLSIAARLKNALGILAEREMLEAASADPSDAENAFDLQDAQCAVDYVISTLAVFAAEEAAEAELGCEMAEMCKALAGFDPAPLGVIEGLSAVRKAGRVLSSSNEQAIRDAVASLSRVLASLPQAPVAKQAEESGMTDTTAVPAAKADGATVTPDEQARSRGPVRAGGTTGMGLPRATGPAASLPGDGPQQGRPGDLPDRQVVKGLHVAVYDQYRRVVGVTDPAGIRQPVAKADGDGEKKPMQAVFDQDGDLIGIVDPDAIMPVTGAGAKPSGDAATPAPDAGDMTPQPPAEAGTPADAVGKSAGEDVITVTQDVLKSIAQEAATTALIAQGAAHQEVVAKMAADKEELAEELKVVKERLETVEKTPAAPRVFTNGQVPPAGQLRGQDQGAPPKVDVAKALERKQALYGAADAPTQDRIFKEMQGDAVAALAAIHAAGRR